MKNYVVTIAVDALYAFDIEATSEEEAESKVLELAKDGKGFPEHVDTEWDTAQVCYTEGPFE